MIVSVIVPVVLACSITSRWVIGSEVKVETHPAPAVAVCDVVHGLQETLRSTNTSYQVLLREMSHVVEPQCVGKPWKNVSNELMRQGLRIIDQWENGDVINCHYLIKTNAFRTASKYSFDLYLMLTAGKLDREIPTKKPGCIVGAQAVFVSNVHLPFSELVAQSRFPKGTVLDRVLTLPEIVNNGAKWPLVRRIYLSYGSLSVDRHQYEESGFIVVVEFESAALNNLRSKNIKVAVKSGLDPFQLKNVPHHDQSFTPTDSLEEIKVLSSGGGED